MRNFQDTFETRNRSFIGAFSICMTLPLRDGIMESFNFQGTHAAIIECDTR